MQKHPWTKADLSLLRQTVTDRLASTPTASKDTKSIRWIVNFYLAVLTSFHSEYRPDIRMVMVSESWRSLSKRIRAGQVCCREGRPLCAVHRLTLSRYAERLEAVGLLGHVESGGFTLIVPPLVHQAPVLLPPRPVVEEVKVEKGRKPFKPEQQPEPPPAPEPQQSEATPPDIAIWLGQQGVSIDWSALTFGEQEDWYSRFNEWADAHQPEYLAIIKQVKGVGDGKSEAGAVRA